MKPNSIMDINQRNLNFQDNLNGDNNIKGGQNLKAITLYMYPNYFLLEPNKETKIPKKLVIERQSGRIIELAMTDKIPDNYQTKTQYSAFLGILNILDKTFLLMIDDAISIGTIEGSEIYSIGSTSYISFINENDFYMNQTNRDIVNYIQNIKKLLSIGHYFSYGYNLTLAKMKQSTIPPSSSQQIDMKFSWNGYLFKDLFKFNIDKKWLIPMIQGYVGIFDTYLTSKKLEFILISRRSCYKAGTRYNARGIDDNGNVANYCETEQIIYYNNYCCSYLQIRGSVPLFWQQRGMTAQTKITRSYDLTNGAFLKHFDDMKINYGRILCVNLLSKSKSHEQMITEGFEQHIRNNNLDYVKYEYFDFHNACKGQKFNKINPLITKLATLIDHFKFYAEDKVKKNIVLTQIGIIRTNCLDCLDRTNVFQSKIALTVFDVQMRQLGIDLTSILGQDALSEMDDDNIKQHHPFMSKYKNIWADNGDMISMHYAGTGSVISGVTRTGKRNFYGIIDHGMKSLNRFYISNFEDQSKQESIDILLGQHTETVNVFSEQFDKAIKIREKEFSSYSDITIYTVTWNLGGFEPYPQYDFTHLLDWESYKNPDIIVISFQEFIELNAKNVMINSSGTDTLISIWKNIIMNSLKQYDRYLFVREKNLVGILTLIFAKESISNRINRVEAEVVKTGLAGKLGNKGGVVIKLWVNDSSFAFINVHLEAGNSANNARLMNLIDIHQKAFQEEGVGKRREEKITNLDYRFLLGDMNFRINLNNIDTRAIIDNYLNFMGNNKIQQANQVLTHLLKYDQLKNSRESNDILEKYQEGLINFLPTYKYDKFSSIYDSSKKQRTPSWTDRILWSTEYGKVSQFFYKRLEIKDSDHRPVISMFIVQIKKVNTTKKEEIIKQIYENDIGLKKVIEEEEKVVHDIDLLGEEIVCSQNVNVIEDLI